MSFLLLKTPNRKWIEQMSGKLALLGGEPLIGKEFPPYNTIGEDEKREVMEVLDSGVLSAYVASPGPEFFGGEKVKKLERAWEEYFEIKHAVSMNSATSALLAAVTACNIGPGDEVILPPLTMSATATAILANNAVPIFADVDPHTLNIDPESVAERITERTRAIFVVHLAGYPCDMDPIMELAEEHGLFVLEDNAQAPGALYKGRFAGCIGHIGVFSLNCHKTIQCGEGGIAVSNDDDLAMRLRLVRNHGEKCLEDYGYGGKTNLIGFNLRLPEMEAAVAYHQLQKLEKLNSWRIRLANHLTKRIKDEFDCITPPYVSMDCTHVYYIYHMDYDEQYGGIPLDLFSEAIQAEGIPILSRWGAPLYYMSIYRNLSAYGKTGCPFRKPYYAGEVRYEKGLCPVAEASEYTSLFIETLVRWPNTIEDMDMVVEAIQKVLEGRESLLSYRREAQ